MSKTATFPALRSDRSEDATSGPSFRRSVFPSKGACGADYSSESYVTAIRRADDINNIESERRYCFAAAVMPRRTDAINSIESERRNGSTRCGGDRADSETYEILLQKDQENQEDTDSALRPLVVYRFFLSAAAPYIRFEHFNLTPDTLWHSTFPPATARH